MTIEKAPVAGAQAGSSARDGGRLGGGLSEQHQALFQAAQRISAGAGAGSDDNWREALGAGGGRAGGEREELLRQLLSGQGLGVGGASDERSGAAAAAGVLTAVDEDDESGEEAPVPTDFEYFTDNEEEEEL